MNDLSTVFILSVSSDIGLYLAERYLAAGFRVIGTYRRNAPESLCSHENFNGVMCDVSKPEDVLSLQSYFRQKGYSWSVFISAVGVLEPIGMFMDCGYGEWERSVEVNSLQQLGVLHSLYDFRDTRKASDVVFFAGGGTNGPFPRYSAYCVGKVVLIKMCELLNHEYADLNPFIVGTGWVNTKIHQQTLEAGESAGENLQKTQAFFEQGAKGTSLEEIFDCIEWCRSQGKAVVGGRNFSVVHDCWRDGGEKLASELKNDENMYKLRRFKNDAVV